jgi:alkanesulfonate monooxygenase SsuD/methylene tetrahydromethanopterin reductase-like flavin-dependent oxidoreductase (luciferase family)
LRSASLSLEGSVDDARAQIDAWRAAGFGYLIVGWPSGGREQIEEFARAVLIDS